MKRKLWILPLVLIVWIVSMIPSLASQDSVNAGAAVTDGAGSPGQEVRLRISVKSVFADNVGIVFNYDKEVLTLSEESSWLLSDENGLSDVDTGRGIAVWGAEAMDIRGDIFEAVFLVDEDASLGTETEVTCTMLAQWNETRELEQELVATVRIQNNALIGGNVTVGGKEGEAICVELFDSEGNRVGVQNVEGEGAFAFEAGVGEYVLRISKEGYCPAEYKVSMDTLEDKLQNVDLRVYGDVKGDNKINASDARQLMKYVNGRKSSIDADEEYLTKVADVNGDGIVEKADAEEILKYYNGKPSALDE